MRDQTGRDTIFALSSGAVPSGVAVIRMSGPETRAALETMTGRVPEPRFAAFRAIQDGEGRLLDKGIALYFPGPRSVTGEDCGELHVHGGRAVVAAVLEALGTLSGLRAAEAGEFTKRAFVNGKMDLTGAEALSDLIDAETEAQRRFAMANADGRHRALYEDWRTRLVEARALIEADLDFADESDVPGSVAGRVWRDVGVLVGEIETHVASYKAGEIAREGFRVVILGAPNAGKSSLLNALARRDVAIVTDEPGTTRDSLEVALDVHGVKIFVTDTAGIREQPGKVEALGIERALARAGEADLVIAVEDVALPSPVEGPEGVPVLRVANKCDLIEAQATTNVYELFVSAKTGAGIEKLVARIGADAARRVPEAGEIIPFRLRHLKLLAEASDHLTRAVAGNEEAVPELRAEELRLAADALGRIAGTIDAEDLLDVIFARFCIGK